MLPDQGCYEERYRSAGPIASAVAFSLVPLIPALLGSQALPWLMLSLVAFALITLPCVFVIASRMIAFRADAAGITLGTDPVGWPFRRLPAVFVPGQMSSRSSSTGEPEARFSIWDVQRIGIQRRQGAPTPPRGNKPAPGCPVPGVAAGVTRPITTWRLDRERLAALTAAVAPGIPIVDASAGPISSIDAPEREIA